MFPDPEYESAPATRRDIIWCWVGGATAILAGVISWYVTVG